LKGESLWKNKKKGFVNTRSKIQQFFKKTPYLAVLRRFLWFPKQKPI